MTDFLKRKLRGMRRVHRLLGITLVLFIGVATCLLAGPFWIDKPEHAKGHFKFRFNTPRGTNSYVQILSKGSLQEEWKVVALDWGQDKGQSWIDEHATDDTRFYKVIEVLLTDPGDVDGDGIDDVFELEHPHLDPLDSSDAKEDSDGDGLLNLQEYRTEKEERKKKKGHHKIILDAVSMIPDTPSLTVPAFIIYSQYRIRPTDGHMGESKRKKKGEKGDDEDDEDEDEDDEDDDRGRKKRFYIRQTVEIVDSSETTIRTLTCDFSIPPSGKKKPHKYISVTTSITWNGKDENGVPAADDTYTYRVTGTYLRVCKNKEKTIGVSNTLEETFAIEVDPDSDGMADWWEEMYLGSTDTLPGDDPDGDGVNNLAEYLAQTDPEQSDTDRDGFEDGFELGYGVGLGYAVSRAFIEWGHADFTIGDDYVYTMPGFVQRAYRIGGEWVDTLDPGPIISFSLAASGLFTNPVDLLTIDWDHPDAELNGEQIYWGEGYLLRRFLRDGELVVQEIEAPITSKQAGALLEENPLLMPFIMPLLEENAGPGFNPSEWHVPASEPDGFGSLNIELDRSIVTTDLKMEIKFKDHAGSSLYVDLLSIDYTMVASDLYGNIITDTDQILWITNDVPLETYPNAAVIRLRRGTGETTVGETILYVDQDGDGLDAGQEAILNTSDFSTDSDGDGTDDNVEVVQGTDPANAASFLTSISGTITYGGSQTGTVWVVVNTNANLWPAQYITKLTAPGIYTVANVPTLTNYWVRAFVDKNGNGTNECWEAIGSYAGNPVYLADNISGIGIAILDPLDTDGDGLPNCWELFYFGNSTAAIATVDEEPDGLNNLQEFQQNMDPFNPDTDGDGIYDGGGYVHIQFASIALEVVADGMKVVIGYPDNFAHGLDIFTCNNLVQGQWQLLSADLQATGTNSISWVDTDAGNHSVRFYAAGSSADPDNDGLSSGWEHYISKTDRNNPDTDGDKVVDGDDPNPLSNIDTDSDGMPDDWETYHGLNPSASGDASTDLDSDDMPNLWEYTYGFSPTDPSDADLDTDKDGYLNIYEHVHSTDPTDLADMPVRTIAIPGHYPTIQEGIDAAASDYDIIKVYPGVINGPGGGIGLYTGTGNKNLDFRRKKIMLVSSTGADSTTIDCENSGRAVLFSSGEGPRSVLHGFTIQNGDPLQGLGQLSGGGIACENSSPTISGCVIRENAAYYGGGIYLTGGNARIRDCAIELNTSELYGGGIACYQATAIIERCILANNASINVGGGIACRSGSSPTIVECVIKENLAASLGGGVFLSDTGTEPSFEGCIIQGNTASDVGGGVYVTEASPTFLNTLVAGNSVDIAGGGFGVLNSAVPTIRNCTVAQNSAELDGSAVYLASSPGASFVNTIVWHNTVTLPTGGHIKIASGGNPSFAYCNVEGGWSGTGNINADPKLTMAYRLMANSPSIDTGTATGAPATDFEGEARWNHPEHADPSQKVDMGYDEFVDMDLDHLADIWEKKYFHSLAESGQVDTDGDGLSNEKEYEIDTDPTSNLDTDGDGLSDDAEKYYGTNPNLWDTDGDLMPDGLEVQHGLNPLVIDATGDYDTDGVSNFDEIRHGSDPFKADTDGDGINDDVEIAQGSDPADADDEGNPANCVSLELRVGDHSGSHSERYSLLVGHVYHVAPQFGVVASDTYAFVKGKVHTFEVRWVASNGSTPDYDYTATIGGLGGSGSGDGFAVDDPQGILGVHTESIYDFAAGKSGTLYIIGVRFVDKESNPISNKIITGGIEFTTTTPTLLNATQDRLFYVNGANTYPNTSAVKLYKNDLYYVTIDFPQGVYHLSKPILVVTEHCKESLLQGITQFHVVKAKEDDVLSIRAVPTIGPTSGNLDTVNVDEILIPIAAKIVKGTTSGVGSIRTSAEINSLLVGIDNINQIWSQFGYSFTIDSINQSLPVPDQYADSVYFGANYAFTDQFYERSPVVDLTLSTPENLEEHSVEWRIFSGATGPTVMQIQDASSLNAEVYKEDGAGLTLVQTLTCTQEPHGTGGVKVKTSRPIGSTYELNYEYKVRFIIVSGGETYYSPSYFTIRVNEFYSILNLDRSGPALHAYFVREFEDPLVDGNAANPYVASNIRRTGFSVGDGGTTAGFQSVSAHEIGHTLGQVAHVFGAARLMAADSLGNNLKVDDSWKEYIHTYPFATEYDDNNEN